MAQESLAPVAAITNLILGIITVFMSNRGENQSSHKRFSALLIGWTFIMLAIYQIAETLQVQYFYAPGPSTIDFGLFTLEGNVAADTLILIRAGCQITLNILMVVMALHIPRDVGRGELWNVFILGLIGLYCLVIPPIVFLIGFKSIAIQLVLWVLVGLFWVHTYIRGLVLEITTGDDKYRSLSKSSAILLIIWFGWQMVWWFSAITLTNNDWFVSVLTSMPENPPALWLLAVNLGWSIGALTIMVLFVGEIFRSIKIGSSPITYIVLGIFILGFFNWIQDTLLLDSYYSCLEGTCEETSEIFDLVNYLTSGVLIYLIKPLLFVYLMVQFKIIDTSSEQNKNLMRIMILLILLIISSSIIELLQSLIPIPQMISGSILAIGVVFFIGWEEKITSKFMGGSNQLDIESIQGDGFNETMLKNMSLLMSLVVIYIIIIGVVFANAGV